MTSNFIFLFIQGQSNHFLPLTKLETKDGLSSPNVRKIVQDKYGFMWFATQDGLNRFDGSQFVRYISASPDPGHAILESDVYDIAVDKSGNYLWCLTAYGGLSKINIVTGKVTDVFPLPVHPTTRDKLWFKSMSIQHDLAYIGTNEGYVVKFDVVSGKTVSIKQVNPGSTLKHPVDKIYADSLGQVWCMLSGEGIHILDSGLQKSITFRSIHASGINSLSGLVYTGFCKINDLLLISSSGGLVPVSIQTREIVPLSQLSFTIPISVSKGNLHCITNTDQFLLVSGSPGLFVIDKKKNIASQIRFSKNFDDNKWLTLTYSIHLSGETIWIGSQYGVGWIKNIYTPFTGYYNSMNGNGTRIEHSITICPANDSVLAVCGDDGLYFCNYNSGNISRFNVQDFYYHALKVPGDYILASAITKGFQLARTDGTPVSLEKVFPELTTIKKDLLISSAFLGDSICFMASQNENGIYIWNYRKKNLQYLHTASRPVALKSNIINRLYTDSKNKLWIIGDNVVSVYDHFNRSIEHLDLKNPRTHESLSINMDICEAGGRYWLVTYGTGIIELTPGRKIQRIYSAKEGINNLGLYKIFPVNDSLIIASSNNGLSVLNIYSGRIGNYFEGDGLHANNFEETSGCVTSKYIFLGGIKGLTKIEKERFVIQNKNARTYISNVHIQGRKKSTDISDLLLNKIIIPSASTQVTVHFANLNYAAPEKTNFQYRLLGLAEEWIPIGTQRFVTLSGLPPGQYNLELISASEDGQWSDPVELHLKFLPKWYQTWWFKTLVVMTIIGVAYALYRNRINQLKKEEKIRNQVAGDLHDELGSTLNSVKIFASLALMEKEKEKTTPHLEKIKEATQGAIAGVRDIIWVLDDKRDFLNDLLSRIQQFAKPLCEASGISYRQEITGSAGESKLGKEEKRNLYMIIKESINNSIKYANCDSILVTAGNTSGKLEFMISDNGTGFEEEKIIKGNGLKNIRYRATQIGYDVSIGQGEEKGTQVKLEKI